MDVVVDGMKESRQRYVPNTAILETTIDGARRYGAHLGLRAALPPLRPHVPPTHADTPARTGCRPAAHHHPPAADLRLQRPQGAGHGRQQPCALLRRHIGAASHHGRVAELRPARDRVLARPAAHPDRRRRRKHHRQCRPAVALVPRARPDLYWQGWVPRPQHPVRLAGRRSSAPPSPSSCAATRIPVRCWPRSRPRCRRRPARCATGTTASPGCAMPSSP